MGFDGITAPETGENWIDDRLTRHGLSFGFVADDHAVAQHVGADALHVLRRHVTATVQERVCACTERGSIVARGEAP